MLLRNDWWLGGVSAGISYTEVRTKLCGGNIYFLGIAEALRADLLLLGSAGFALTLGCAEAWGKAGFAQNGPSVVMCKRCRWGCGGLLNGCMHC